MTLRMQLPNFLVIGSAKSGTTTLYEYLCKHPQIYMSPEKEPNFFASEENYSRGIEWYASLFKEAQEGQVLGEASTPYTHQLHIDVPQRIFNSLNNDDIKLIYILRHPVDRAYSQYLQQIKIFQSIYFKRNNKSFPVPETFEQLLERGKKVIGANDYMENIDVIEASKYIDIINRYLKFFDEKSFLFLLFEDLTQDTQMTLNKIANFLDIDPNIDLIESNPIKANISSEHHQWYLRSRTTAPLKSIPVINLTAKLLPQKARDLSYKVLKRLSNDSLMKEKYMPQPMLPKTREMLLEKFREPNLELANFLNRDLSHWNV